MERTTENADTVFDTSTFQAKTRLEEWRASMSNAYYSLDITDVGNRGLDAMIAVTCLHDINITDFRSTAAKGFRRRTDIARDSTEYFTFIFVSEGEMYFNQRAESGVLHPGQYVMMRSGEPYELSCLKATRALTLHLPVQMVEDRYPLAYLHCGSAYQNNTALFPLMNTVARSISQIPAEARKVLEQDLKKQALELILLLLRSERGQPGRDPGTSADRLLARVIDHIEDRYLDTDFTAHHAAKSLGISVSHLHRILSQYDIKFGCVVRKARMANAHELLRSSETAGLKVSEIAFKSGFLDHSHFSKIFRQTYGITPLSLQKQPLNS